MIRLLRKRRKAAISASLLRRAISAPTVSPVAVFRGTSIPTCRSPARSISNSSALPEASSGRPSAARKAASLGPSDETESCGGAPGAAVTNAISLCVSFRIWEARASLIP